MLSGVDVLPYLLAPRRTHGTIGYGNGNGDGNGEGHGPISQQRLDHPAEAQGRIHQGEKDGI